MKQLILYSILFCIGFLNVPRSLVHNCDDHKADSHQHSIRHEHNQDHDDHSSEEGGAHISLDDCHVCEIQLDYFEVPEFRIGEASKTHYLIPSPEKVGMPQLVSDLSYDLRGPPSACC